MGRNGFCASMLVLLGVVVIAGCKKQDLSTPQSAAEAYATAAEAGDAEGTKAASTGVGAELTGHFARMVHAGKALHDASMMAFGEKGGDLPPGYNGRKMPVRMVQKATYAINGDAATLTPDDGGTPYYMKKIDGRWKMDLFGVAPWPILGSMEGMAKAMEETTEDIKANKFKSAAEAKAALEKRIQEAK